MQSKPGPLKILVIQTAFIGDSLLAIPLLRELRSISSGGQLDLICRKGLADFFNHSKLVDRAIEWDKKNQKTTDLLNQLPSSHYDLLVVPHRSFRTWLLGIRISASHKISFKSWWKFPNREHIHYDLELPDALRQLALLKELLPKLKADLDELKISQPNSLWGQQSIDFAEHAFPEKYSMIVADQPHFNLSSIPDFAREIPSSCIVVAPGSVWNTKKWTEEGFIELIKLLIKKNENVVLSGSANEADLCQKISDQVSSAQVVNLAGQFSLFESFLFLRLKAKLAITNDSGTMHLAAAAGVRTISLFGPTTLDIGYRPWQKNAIVIQHPLPCRPCGKHGHQSCPIKTHACMKQISAELVFKYI